jgi:hypothetical protein
MSTEHILAAGIISMNSKPAKNTRGHLTTREMYAVQPNRSVVKTLLSTAKDKLARR